MSSTTSTKQTSQPYTVPKFNMASAISEWLYAWLMSLHETARQQYTNKSTNTATENDTDNQVHLK